MRWINVKNKIPDELEEVVFYYKTKIGDEGISLGHFECGKWQSCSFGDSFTLNNNVNVTHWMKLPESPDDIKNKNTFNINEIIEGNEESLEIFVSDTETEDCYFISIKRNNPEKFYIKKSDGEGGEFDSFKVSKTIYDAIHKFYEENF